MNKKKLALFSLLMVILLVGIFLIVSLEQQTYEEVWSKSFGGSNNDEGYFVSSTEDKGCIVLGYTIQNQDLDIYLLKIDENGELEWEKTYGGNGYDYGKSIVKTDDGYVIVGFSNSTKSLEYDYDLYLIKIDENGDLEWEKTYGGNLVEEGTSIIQTNEGNYVITGSTGSYGSPEGDLWVIEINNSGEEIIWNNTFGGNGFNQGRSIVELDDGYVIAGQTKSYSEKTEAWLLKISKTGQQIWNYTYGSDYNSHFNNLIRTDNGFIMVGHSLEKIENNVDKWNGYVVKTDRNGKEQWRRTITEEKDTGISCIEETDDGYILLGYIGKYGEDDLLIEKIDENGKRIWMETIGGDSRDGGVWIDRGNDNNYFVTGYSDIKDNGFTDLWINKFLIE